jgi:hypothetical protein
LSGLLRCLNRKQAEGIAIKKLVGADAITATKLIPSEPDALDINEGDVRF